MIQDNVYQVGGMAIAQGYSNNAVYNFPKITGLVSIARVVYTLLDDSDPEKFKELGGWKSIGTIQCRTFKNNEDNSVPPKIAKPLSSNITQFPLTNEIVLLVEGVSYEAQNPQGNYVPENYYISIIPVWNSPEHNALPNELFFEKGGKEVTAKFNSTNPPRRMIKAPGDITFEGRSGNAIRLGSSIKGFNSPFSGPDRAPLIAISNKQWEAPDKSVATFEDINKDGSSIYMLSGHNVSLVVGSLNFDSYGYNIDADLKSNYTVATQNPVVDNEAAPVAKDNIQEVKVDPVPVVVPVAVASVPSTGSMSDSDFEYSGTDVYEDQVVMVIEGDIDIKKSVYNGDAIPENVNAVTMTGVAGEINYSKDIRWEVQISGEACFAACSAMILKSRGKNVQQSAIMNSKYVNSNNMLDSVGLFKANDLSIVRVNIGGGSAGYNKIVNQYLTTTTPFILQRKSRTSPGDPTANHFVVVVGVRSNGKVLVLDPANTLFKDGPIDLLQSELKENGSMRIIK